MPTTWNTAPVANTKQVAWRNPWVLGWVGMILLVLLANTVMITMAVVTSPGLVTEQYYDKGQNYAGYLERKAQAAQLGWEVKLHVPESLSAGVPGQLTLVGVDQRGVPLQLDQARIHFYRPADAALDFAQPMRVVRRGSYAAEMTLPQPGVWDVIVSLDQAGRQFELAQRLFVN